MLRREHRRMVQHMMVLVAVAALALAGVALAGCGGSGKSAKPSKSTTTLNQSAKDKAAVEATIQGWHLDYAVAKTNPGAPHPELHRWATPELIQRTATRLQQLASDGHAARKGPNAGTPARILTATPTGPTSYVVVTCEIDDNLLVNVGTGQVVNGDTGVYRTKWEMERQPNGGWLLAPAIEQTLVGHSAAPGWEHQCDT